MFIRGATTSGIVYMSETGGGGGTGGGTDGGTGGGGGGGGTQQPAFAETLPEDIRGEAAFRDIKDLPGLAKSYLAATKMVGGRPEDILRLPTSPDDADGWNATFNRLGRPEKPDGYQFTAPKLPEGVKVNEQLQTAFATKAHEAGLTTKQAAALFDWYNGEVGNQFTTAATTRATAEATAIAGLKAEWGAAFDQKLAEAKAALAHYGDADLVAYLEETRTGNDPRLLKVFAKLGAQLSEDGVIGKAGAGGAGALSPTEAQQQVNALRGDAEFMKGYMDAKHPNHKEAMAKMQGLYEFAYPAQTAA